MNKKKQIQPVSEVASHFRDTYFPLELPNNIICHPSSRDEIISFTSKNWKKIFKDEYQSSVKIKENSKEQEGFLSTCKEYRKIHSEYFVFKKAGKIVGYFYGEMEDFETFYMRSTGILPQYQNLGIYRGFVDQFTAYLKELGYQRVSSQHTTSNSRIISLKMSRGFFVVGTENHDRWGALVKLVKFLNPKREKEFKKLF